MLYEDNYLAHYGIKGQRWGIRRFQNEDGTLTSEGKERYRGSNNRESDASRSQIENALLNRPKDLSNEANKIIDRIKSGEVINDDFINKKIFDDYYRSKKRNDVNNFNDIGFVYNQLPALNRENKYKRMIANESDEKFIDPSYRHFHSKEEKAKAEADYLNKIYYSDPSVFNGPDADKYKRESQHITDRVSNLSMDGYDERPYSERNKKMYSFDKKEGRMVPNYKKSKEYLEIESEKKTIKDKTGLTSAEDALYNRPVNDTSANKKVNLNKLFRAYDKARRKYNEAVAKSDIKNRESKIQKEFDLKIQKNVLMDLGYEVNETNMNLIKGLIWWD